MTTRLWLAALTASTLPLPVWAQSQHDGTQQDMAMPGMDMPAAPKPAPVAQSMPDPQTSPQTPAPDTPPPADPMAGMHDMHDMHDMDMSQSKAGGMTMGGMAMPGMPASGAWAGGSGTSRLPGSDGMMQGVQAMAGDWMLMAHGYAWASYTDQSGPRGRDEAFVTSMAMVTAARDLGGATLTLRTMFSLDPLMGARGYPSLLATGETANGVDPLIDRQHPHDLFMELSARLDVPLGGGVGAFIYGGPAAEPALGPAAFMHRRSAQYLPLAPITHHWFDSTHVTFGVITAGLSSDKWQIEASGFRGREPDQHRWDIETPALDSWSVRATWNPTPDWSAQVSHGRLKSPEALEPDNDEARTTATVQYAHGGLSAMVGFAAKKRLPGRTLTAWLGEANWDVTRHHSLFGRVENLTNDELFPDELSPLHHRPFRVTRAELGYAYRLRLIGPFSAAIGGSGFVIAKPTALDDAYGKTPAGWTGFVKLSLGR